MLSLENTASRMSHLARQEIYFDRQFGLDETLQGIERVTPRRRAAGGGGSVPERLAGGDGARQRERLADSARTARSRLIDDMIPRYTHPEMGRIWSDQRRYETWLLVETAAAEAMAAAGIVPADAARDIRERGAFDIARIEEIEQTTQHDVIAFTTAVAEKVGPSARWLHFGLTSSDVIDTAQALQMREACDVILADLDALADAIRDRALEHRRTPMIGRTHGVHAEPMTFGLKLALWYAEVGRDIERVAARARRSISVGKLSGAVGTFAHLPPAIEADVCRRLGLEPAPVASQVIQRDRHAELLAALAITGASLEKFALEIRGLQKTEIGEVEEPFAQGPEGLVGDAAQAQPDRLRADRRPGAAAARQLRTRRSRTSRCGTSATSRTRRSSASSCPTASSRSITCCAGSRGSCAAWSCIPSGCARTSNRSRGVVFSGTVLLELAKKGVSREQAYEWVQRNAMRSFARAARLQGAAARRSPTSPRVLPPAEIERAFDLDEQFKHVDHIFDRVFHPVRA